MPFSQLGLSPYVLPALQQALQQAGYVAPTPIQQQAVPLIVKGRDLVALAPTGSGKTAAYVLPALQRFSMGQARKPRPLLQLVLVPTRELALQVSDVFNTLGRQMARRPHLVCAVGGVSINPQLMALRGGADIVVATPGRLLDLVAHNALSLGQVQLLVLDEADRLLELGFGDELRQILAELPVRRQTLLFSATFPPDIAALAAAGLRDPQRVEIRDQAQPEIAQRAIRVDAGRRSELLLSLLDEPGWTQVLVFVGSRRDSDRLAAQLRAADISAQALHGDQSQGRRSPADYLHRIGRTGRAGEKGLAVSFVDADALAHWRLIGKRNGMQVALEERDGFAPKDAPVQASVVAADNGGIKGRRPSKKDRLRAAANARPDPAPNP
jgi:superfamily II DNA/RNA helicase